jgi:hypothetical protein
MLNREFNEFEEFIKRYELETNKLKTVKVMKISYNAIYNDIINSSNYNVLNAIPPVRVFLDDYKNKLEKINNEEIRLNIINKYKSDIINRINNLKNKILLFEYLLLFFYFNLFFLTISFEFDKYINYTWRKNFYIL